MYDIEWTNKKDRQCRDQWFIDLGSVLLGAQDGWQPKRRLQVKQYKNVAVCVDEQLQETNYNKEMYSKKIPQHRWFKFTSFINRLWKCFHIG
jgi:hypothetical protein